MERTASFEWKALQQIDQALNTVALILIHCQVSGVFVCCPSLHVELEYFAERNPRQASVFHCA